ncbi:hypothetical protein T7987_12605 [Sulfitobacter faviae]|uniref:Uncharacterized protein n=1 Tax=Sulfitobacter faviae TaxID=1775881 RepID=A0ABZ0UX97_9RHOB|nr:hypothetical protein [Sulfitobacter faviae]WPZ21009.1 hypothetical protein T7987_12605 [Sulfitobacter faviae]
MDDPSWFEHLWKKGGKTKEGLFAGLVLEVQTQLIATLFPQQAEMLR